MTDTYCQPDLVYCSKLALDAFDDTNSEYKTFLKPFDPSEPVCRSCHDARVPADVYSSSHTERGLENQNEPATTCLRCPTRTSFGAVAAALACNSAAWEARVVTMLMNAFTSLSKCWKLRAVSEVLCSWALNVCYR